MRNIAYHIPVWQCFDLLVICPQCFIYIYLMYLMITRDQNNNFFNCQNAAHLLMIVCQIFFFVEGDGGLFL